jgi:hypothetical protein
MLRQSFCFAARYIVACLTAMLLPAVVPAEAALTKTGDNTAIVEACNPKPDKADIALPMPCGGQMVFLPVGISEQGFLWDKELNFGSDESDRQGHGYYERRYSAPISGPFTTDDVPAAWKKKLSFEGGGKNFFYLTGKYEVSEFQWDAVVSGICPPDGKTVEARKALPKTNISWFDAVDFSRKYMAWLLEKHPESLPSYKDDERSVGYLRLPTEHEWEYAAKGGHRVGREDLNHAEIFPYKEGHSVADYAVYRTQDGRIESSPRRIGSRLPNPLGIYDMHGNAAEMTLTPFHFSVGGRLHGAVGGFVRKGGSYLSRYSEILSGRREEAAFFQRAGENRSKDMGFRLVLGGINTPGGPRPDTLRAEWERAGEGQVLLLDQGKNPLEELDRIIAQTKNDNERENLARVRLILKDYNIALERQNNKAAEGLIRSATFMLDSVKNYGIRRRITLNTIENAREELGILERKRQEKQALFDQMDSSRQTEKKQLQTMIKEDDAAVKQVQSQLNDLTNNEAVFRKAMFSAVNFYRDKLDEALTYPRDMFENNFSAFREEFTKDDMQSRNILTSLKLFEGHVSSLRKGNLDNLKRMRLLTDIVPPHFLQGIEEEQK